MKNLTLSVKLVGGFMVVGAITLLVGFFGWRGISQTEEGLREVSLNRLPSILGLEMIGESRTGIQKCERILVYEQDPEIVKRQYPKIEEEWKQVEKGWKIYEPLPQTQEEEQLWKQFVPKWDAWKKQHQEVIDLVKKGDLAGARALSYGKARDALDQASELLKKITDLNIKVADDFTKDALPHAARTKMISLIGMFLGAGVALAIGIVLSLSITRPINNVVVGIKESGDQVSAASGQLSSSSQQLAEGASQQAASLEETSSSLEEMASMTRQNAENANQADQLMRDTINVVARANDSMTELTTSIQEISMASEETQKIIKTIDEIAFQTNLLALNAAVEAARAGEAGAGFAVVADEVRNLAMRAAEAAKNTSGLIEGTVKKVKDGGDLVRKTNEAFSEVSASSTKVGELVAEIASASSEQAQGISQLNTAVADMDKVIQQNAANAEESAAASEELSAQADQMRVHVQALLEVVGGNAAKGRRSPKSHNAGPRSGYQAVVKTTALHKVTKHSDRGGKGNGKLLSGHAGSSKVVHPENVLALSEEDYSDF